MTEKKIDLSNVPVEGIDLVNMLAIDILMKGFLLAGGQIIEEPKNLPCKWCGAEVVDAKNCIGTVYHQPVTDCILSNKTFDKEVWNDESKRGKLG